MFFFIWVKLLMVINMKSTKYNKVADRHKPFENRIYNAFVAFISGGVVGFLGELLIEVFCKWIQLSRSDAGMLMILIFIFLASLGTGLGFFDKFVTKFKCGLIIPITGFAHSMTSSAMDYRKEGLVYGIGSNMFKLAGTVIVYGIVSSWFFGLLRYLIGGGA